MCTALSLCIYFSVHTQLCYVFSLSSFLYPVCVCFHISAIHHLAPAGPMHLGATLPRRSGFKVYVLTSRCKWVQYPAPRPSPRPFNRRAICAAKSGNSAPRTKHLENQLDLFLHGQADCQTTQGF